MRIPKVVVCAAGLATLLASLILTSRVNAAPTNASTVFGPYAELSKVTLAETSLDGPGLWTSGTDTVKAVLAWTGTDPAHTLNVEFISLPNFTVTGKTTFWGENRFNRDIAHTAASFGSAARTVSY
jgi:hypothetical protein